MSKRNIAAVVFFTIVAIFFVFSALMMHPFGAPDETDMDDGIITNAQNETGANNGVTSVVRQAPTPASAIATSGACKI